jgi:protein-tyrosine-phosphatase
VASDISGEFPKPWTEVVRATDVVITMGWGDACPIFPGKKYQDWELADPAGMAVEDIRPVRDEIERRVLALLDQLHVPRCRVLTRGGRIHASGDVSAAGRSGNVS